MPARSFLHRGLIAGPLSLVCLTCMPVLLAAISQSASKVDVLHRSTRISSSTSVLTALVYIFWRYTANLAGKKDADRA
jgi:hypothetical protein